MRITANISTDSPSLNGNISNDGINLNGNVSIGEFDPSNLKIRVTNLENNAVGTIDLSYNSQTSILTLTTKNIKDESIGTPKTVDIPTGIKNISYNNASKELTITLLNDKTMTVSIKSSFDELENIYIKQSAVQQTIESTSVDIPLILKSGVQTASTLAFKNSNNTLIGFLQISYLLDNKLKFTDASHNTKIVAMTDDLTNFITNTVDNLTNYYLKSETYTQTEIDNLIAAIPKVKLEIVQTLPTASATYWFDNSHTIYLLPKSTAQTNNSYDEYICTRSGTEGSYVYSWEKIGDTEIDLSNYYTKTETDTLLSNKQNTLVSGTNIKTINNESLLGEGNLTVVTDISGKMDKVNPTGSGSLSIGRKENTTIGDNSVAVGDNNTASGKCAVALGGNNEATGGYSFAEGSLTLSSSTCSHAEGNATSARGVNSHSEGYKCMAMGENSHAQGEWTVAQRLSQFTFGAYNILDDTGSGYGDKGDYIEIVGNGTSNYIRSNARTLDWLGNQWLAGNITLGGLTTLANAASSSITLTLPSITGTLALTSDIPSVATSALLGLIKIASDTVQTEAAQSVTSTSGRTYAIQLNSSNQAVVNVPWENTTYESKTASSGGTDVSLVTTGEKYTWNSKQDALDTTQMAAVNSGANSTNIGQISTNTSDISTINGKIPSTATSSNKLTDEAFVNSSINALAAFFITRTAQGDNFNTNSQLLAATTFYSGGTARIPTTNDYTYVRWDESKGEITSGYASFTTTADYIGHYVIYNNEGIEVDSSNKDSLGITPGTTIAYDNLPTTRYSYQGGTYPNGQWNFQLIVNNSGLTAAQMAAINSGITSTLVGQISTNQTDISSLSSNKVDKTSQTYKIYGTSSNGNQITLSYSNNTWQASGKIVQRDSNSDVIVPASPSSNNAAISKTHADSTYVSKTSTANQVYTTDSNGDQTTRTIKESNTFDDLNWQDSTNHHKIPDISTIAFWDGAYQDDKSSNLKYCDQGQIIGDNGNRQIHVNRIGCANATDVPLFNATSNQIVLESALNGSDKTYCPAIGFVERNTSDASMFMHERNIMVASGATNDDIPQANKGYKIIHEGNLPLRIRNAFGNEQWSTGASGTSLSGQTGYFQFLKITKASDWSDVNMTLLVQDAYLSNRGSGVLQIHARFSQTQNDQNCSLIWLSRTNIAENMIIGVNETDAIRFYIYCDNPDYHKYWFKILAVSPNDQGWNTINYGIRNGTTLDHPTANYTSTDSSVNINGYGYLSDMNTVVNLNKTFYYNNSTTNQPEGDSWWGVVQYILGDSNYSIQIVYRTDADYFYTRIHYNDNRGWQSWNKYCSNPGNVTQLLTSQISANSNVTLNDTITKYRYIIISGCDQSNGGKAHVMLPTTLFTSNVDSAIQNAWSRLVVTTSDGWVGLWYTGESNGKSVFHIDGFSSSPNFNWLLVYGVK